MCDEDSGVGTLHSNLRAIYEQKGATADDINNFYFPLINSNHQTFKIQPNKKID